MADAHIDETVFIPSEEISLHIDTYGPIGVVIYSKAFAVNGHQIRIIPSEPIPAFRWLQE